MAEVVHAAQYIVAAHRRARRVHDRVVGRGRDWQPRERSRLSHAKFRKRSTEVRARGAREAVGSLPEVDLVHVDLENLVLRELTFDLEGHGDLVELARVRSLRGEKEVSGNLLRDGRAALGAAPREEVDDGRARDPGDFNPGVLVEVGVFGAQNGIFDVLGDLIEVHEVAALFAEFANQLAVSAPDAKRHLRSIVRQRIDRRQLSINEGKNENCEEHAGGKPCRAEACKPFEKSADARAARSSACGFFRSGRHR